MVNSPNLHKVLGDSDCIIADCTCGDDSEDPVTAVYRICAGKLIYIQLRD